MSETTKTYYDMVEMVNKDVDPEDRLHLIIEAFVDGSVDYHFRVYGPDRAQVDLVLHDKESVESLIMIFAVGKLAGARRIKSREFDNSKKSPGFFRKLFSNFVD